MIEGHCLCGAIRFAIRAFVGPFELCHCSRCQKASGSAFVSGIGVKTADFEWISGQDRIRTYEAPVVETPPGYPTAFCEECGSPAPHFKEDDEWFELRAGLLGPDFFVPPDRHIYVDCGSDWFEIAASFSQLPQWTKRDVYRLRSEGSG